MSKSIVKEITFTPQAFEKEYNLVDTRKRLGGLIHILESIEDNGIIIGIDREKWLEKINKFVEEYDDSEKKDLEKVLDQLHDRQKIAKYPQTFTEELTEDEWINYAKAISTNRGLDLVVATIETDFTKKIDMIDSSIYRNKGAKVIVQTQENMKEIITPILGYAEIVTIIDPYFNISIDRFNDAIGIICESLGNHHGKQEAAIIDIHTSTKTLWDKNDMFDWKGSNAWSKKIQEYEKKYGHIITIHVWEDYYKKDELHDRWLITNQCGIYIGKGSDISDWTKSTWGILDWSDIPAIVNQFNIPIVENSNSEIKTYKHIGLVNRNGLIADKKAKNVYKTAEEISGEKITETTAGGLRIQRKK